ncbi:MAG: serine/threonine-protein phosphatase [Actinobacteria bacterium]|nr:serine/threonine-protein phosphatase [Actinomycetota bacterium]MCA1722227.1 serine/threonine-protein phosphatase [Actinomycetota bacterium]
MLRSCLKAAQIDGHIDALPLLGVKAPRTYSRQPAVLTLGDASLSIETLATLWYGEYRPSSGELSYVSAGHPAPILTVHGDPARLLAEASAPPLGVGLAHQHAANATETLPPGSVLVAYSDGLVERRRSDIEEQLAALQRVVTDACDPARADTAKDIAANILDALVPDLDRAEDDVCVLVVMRGALRAS